MPRRAAADYGRAPVRPVDVSPWWVRGLLIVIGLGVALSVAGRHSPIRGLETSGIAVVVTALLAVAIVEQVNEAEAARTWARFGKIPDQAFYLYVPVGYGAVAKRICKKLKIKVAGFRTWRTTPRGFEINDVSEAPSPLAALMPPIVRKLLATP